MSILYFFDECVFKRQFSRRNLRHLIVDKMYIQQIYYYEIINQKIII